MQDALYDVCVVGAGMIGSSAAKYACMHLDAPKVCLIGPEEPQDRSSTDIFAAHYDAARITRSTDANLIWAKLAKRSIGKYKDIEAASGIQFYNNVGCLTVGEKNGEFIKNTYNSSVQQGIPVQYLAERDVATMFPPVKMSADRKAVLEMKDAGTINPRNFVKAQQRIAAQNGCTIMKEIVKSVDEVKKGKELVMCVKTDAGNTVFAKKVLIATGIFTAFRRLLPEGVEPDIQPTTQTVVFAEVSEQQLPTMSRLPAYIFHADRRAENDLENEDCYILPPVQSPDGKYYMKIGHSRQFETVCNKQEEVTLWFRNGTQPVIKNSLLKLLLKVFPGLEPASVYSDTCCTGKTPSGLPYVDLLSPRLAVALGGNGFAAKSCDELGRLAATFLQSGVWPAADIPREQLRFTAKKPTAKL